MKQSLRELVEFFSSDNVETAERVALTFLENKKCRKILYVDSEILELLRN